MTIIYLSTILFIAACLRRYKVENGTTRKQLCAKALLVTGVTLLAGSSVQGPSLIVSIAPNQLQPEQGKAYTFALPEAFRDISSEQEGASNLTVSVDGAPLKGGFLHDTIRQLGDGRYSHWGNTIYFSYPDSAPKSSATSLKLEKPRTILDLILPAKLAPFMKYFVWIGGFLVVSGLLTAAQRTSVQLP